MMISRRLPALLGASCAVFFALIAASVGFARADEGMWTYNRFPVTTLAERHGFSPDAAWFDHVRLASARLAQGCSASFVSAQGLVMTNHHCVRRCIEQLSGPREDLVTNGFLAATPKAERRCPNLEVNQLVAITDVTERVRKAAEGLADAAANAARKAEMTRIEQECATGPELRCDVVTLYDGGIYDLYTYRRHQDVRLVFAPELATAFFGGDPDNFMFPRFALDMAFIRVWENDKPAATPHFFRWSENGAAANELVFVSGNPGSTSRQKTIAETLAWRDRGLVRRLLMLSELRGQLVEYARRGKEQARHSKNLLFGVENGLKAFKGEADALFAPGFIDTLKSNEDALRQRVAADPTLAKTHGGAWDAIAAAVDESRHIGVRHALLEGAQGFRSDLFGFARHLVRAAAERPKPAGERLREYTDARLPGLEQAVFSTAPIYAEFEVFRLTFALTRLREELGPDDPTVRAVLGRESPEQLAQRLVKGTKLADVKVRRKLWEGGQAAIEASGDPLIKLALLVDGESRSLRKRMEDEVEAIIERQHALIAEARFRFFGTSAYPDATFTPRLSFGTVKGWVEGERTIAPFTTIGGAFERHTGADPFALPKSWLTAKPRLDLAVPLNLSTDNDIIGGNSGSPMVNRKAEIVGLIFDGNIHSLGGDYGFDTALNRAVAVDSRGMMHTLEMIYRADALVKELRGR
jgi:hypothetical protein